MPILRQGFGRRGLQNKRVAQDIQRSGDPSKDNFKYLLVGAYFL